MKGHKAHHHRKHHADGGAERGDPKSGDREYEADLKADPMPYNHGRPQKEAEERKHGGRTKRKTGGMVKHHEEGKHMGHAKHVGHVHGHMEHHAGRKPRKSGGRTGSNMNPLSSAHSGVLPPHHKDANID